MNVRSSGTVFFDFLGTDELKNKRRPPKSNFTLPPEISPNIIPVTRPLLPPLKEFTPYLRQIWKNQWLTNDGPFHQKLEMELAEYLGVKHLSLFTNGTIALVTALQALGIKGEVITTPFSFVATTHALRWNNLTPVFADIGPDTFNLDPEKVEAAITPRTSAILPVHCYGRPCDTARFDRIGRKYGLKVIYDAAHAFGVRDTSGSILRHGDLTILSFHATKVFNTFEGGAIISPNAGTKRHIDHLKNFGYVDEVTVVDVGINGKMNELQSAFGLLQLKYIGSASKKSRKIDLQYRERLKGLRGITLFDPPKNVTHNYSYFPILVNEDHALSRDELYSLLKKHGIYARRYFYPLISNMPMYRDLPSSARGNLPQANSFAERVICLPIFPSMTEKEVGRVAKVITGF